MTNFLYLNIEKKYPYEFVDHRFLLEKCCSKFFINRMCSVLCIKVDKLFLFKTKSTICMMV